MNQNNNGVETHQCHPRCLKKKLEQFLVKHNPIKTTKRKRIIAWLICIPECGCKVTRFNAEPIGDHCFNTTVSEIWKLERIVIHRQETKRPNQFSSQSGCHKYWLDDGNIDKAMKSFNLGWVNK